VNYGGPAGDSDAIEAALLDAAAAVADEWRVDYVEMRSQRHLGDRYPSSEHKVSMTVALAPDPDTVWNGYKAKAGPRQDIRRGYKNGFTAKFGGLDVLADFYEVLSESWRDLGTPIYQKAYLEDVLTTFPQDTRICVVSAADGTPAAAALCGHHRDVVEGMWLGTRARFRRDMVGYVLYWELIKDACERGFAKFHLGRSTVQSGGEQFKKKWNAEAVQLYWQYMLRRREEIPSLNVQNPRYRLAIKAWQNLPVPVTQMIGPLIARSIP
jgi:FemAB-related protein (PEP-CTERM system-associated)